nr:MAG TPA: MoaC family [Caudoviricetes sp.]DAN96542.1 MAG TPA: MoaC family [Caudoviricetes sp.]
MTYVQVECMTWGILPLCHSITVDYLYLILRL